MAQGFPRARLYIVVAGSSRLPRRPPARAGHDPGGGQGTSWASIRSCRSRLPWRRSARCETHACWRSSRRPSSSSPQVLRRCGSSCGPSPQWLRDSEVLLQQSERLAALGTLAPPGPGLNNPASAVRSAASHLRGRHPAGSSEPLCAGLGSTKARSRRLPPCAKRWSGARRRPPLELPLAISDRESELEALLERSGVEGAWAWAPSLVARGWDASDLSSLL
jgi:hypothetical protein